MTLNDGLVHAVRHLQRELGKRLVTYRGEQRRAVGEMAVRGVRHDPHDSGDLPERSTQAGSPSTSEAPPVRGHYLELAPFARA